MASSVDSDALSLMVKGKAYYEDKKHAKAAAVFKQVANACACGVQARNTPCLCKSLVEAIVNGKLEDELRKKCICSAKSNIRCKNTIHLDALDGLAATQEAQSLVDLAIVTAEMMINLAPREPKGFLRLGKLLRLKDSYHTAYLNYQQGIELVTKKNPSHELLSILHHVKEKVQYRAFAVDPLKLLPVELLVMIFKNIDLRSLCRCLRVSKGWKASLTSRVPIIQSLWRIQDFSSSKKAPRLPQLKQYSIYAGSKVTELVIDNCHQFGMDTFKFQWLIISYPHLKVLKLLSPSMGDQLLDDHPVKPCVSRLTSLYLGYHIPFSPQILSQILTSSAETLKELTLLNIQLSGPRNWRDAYRADCPVLKRLEILRLGSRDLRRRVVLDMQCFINTCPNVEEVWMDVVELSFSSGTKYQATPWSKIKRLFVGKDVIIPSGQHQPIRLSAEIEELHVRNDNNIRMFLQLPFEQDPDTYPEPTKLHTLTLQGLSASELLHFPDYLQRWIEPGLKSGALKELELRLLPVLPDWLRSDQLTYLNLHGLTVRGGTDYIALEKLFFSVVDRFPKLEAIDIGYEPISDAALGKVIQKGVKAIYHCRASYERHELRAWAQKEHNARIIQGEYTDTLPMITAHNKYRFSI
ncbi:hypothetical protein F5Y19DRAFT_449352 [Xylariaceae sp. FL1651]|nr:hypothetical protein F5Y19DRAFT_449352 [Xylariaceae sp. FL1651]